MERWKKKRISSLYKYGQNDFIYCVNNNQIFSKNIVTPNGHYWELQIGILHGENFITNGYHLVIWKI